MPKPKRARKSYRVSNRALSILLIAITLLTLAALFTRF